LGGYGENKCGRCKEFTAKKYRSVGVCPEPATKKVSGEGPGGSGGRDGCGPGRPPSRTAVRRPPGPLRRPGHGPWGPSPSPGPAAGEGGGRFVQTTPKHWVGFPSRAILLSPLGSASLPWPGARRRAGPRAPRGRPLPRPGDRWLRNNEHFGLLRQRSILAIWWCILHSGPLSIKMWGQWGRSTLSPERCVALPSNSARASIEDSGCGLPPGPECSDRSEMVGAARGRRMVHPGTPKGVRGCIRGLGGAVGRWGTARGAWEPSDSCGGDRGERCRRSKRRMRRNVGSGCHRASVCGGGKKHW